MTATGTPRHEGSTGRRGFAVPWANCFKSGLLDIPSYGSIYIYYELTTHVCRWSRYHDKAGAYKRWRTYREMYGDFIQAFSKARAGTLPPYHLITIDWSPAIFCHISVEWSRAVFTQLHGLRSRAQEPDHGFGLNHSMPYEQINEWVFSYDGRDVTGLWDCDEKSMEDAHYGG